MWSLPSAMEAADASSKRSHEAADEPAAAASRPKFDLTRGSEPALGLLTALGVPRSEALGFLAERAVEKLIEAVPTMPARRRGMLLAAAFAQIDSPRLRPVAVAALEAAGSDLPQDIVQALTGVHKELLATLPLRVRQRVWETEDPPQLFLAETHNLVVILTDECRVRFERAAERSAADVPPKQRRAESQALQQLVGLVSAKSLYAALVTLTREIYGQTADAAMGALRTDLIMSIHEADDAERPISRWEGMHTFVCCLDAASREGRFEVRALRILINHAIAAGIPPLIDTAATDAGQQHGPQPASVYLEVVADLSSAGALADLALLLSPPSVLHLLTETLLTRLESIVDAHALPGSDEQMRMLVQLHGLATRAAPLRIADKRKTLLDKWAATTGQMLHKALPIVCELMVDDHAREAAHAGGVAGARADERGAPPVPPEVSVMLQRGFARHVLLQYIIRRVEAADEARCEQMLPMAASVGADLSAHPEFAGGLVSALIADPSKRLAPRLARAAISQCLLPLAAQLPHAHQQLLRLLLSQWQLLHALPAEGATGEVSSILAARGVDGGTLLSSVLEGNSVGGAGAASKQSSAAADSGGGGGGVLSLLQYAARGANERGATEPRDEQATEQAYKKLARLVPGLMGGRGRVD